MSYAFHRSHEVYRIIWWCMIFLGLQCFPRNIDSVSYRSSGVCHLVLLPVVVCAVVRATVVYCTLFTSDAWTVGGSVSHCPLHLCDRSCLHCFQPLLEFGMTCPSFVPTGRIPYHTWDCFLHIYRVWRALERVQSSSHLPTFRWPVTSLLLFVFLCGLTVKHCTMCSLVHNQASPMVL